jgi:DNA repair protein RadD
VQQIHQSPFSLRPYQEQSIQATLGKPFSLIVLPTGGGKSVIFAEITRRYKCKTLILVNKNVLVENTARYIDAKIYHASSGRKEFGEITIACWQSLVRAKSIPEFDLVIIDEIHEYDLVKLDFIKRKKTIGFTATPIGFERADYFRSFESMTPEYLSPIIYRGKNVIETNEIKVRKGEYVTSDMEKVYESENETIAKDILAKSSGRKFIVVICISIEHCNLMASLLGAFICHSQINQRKEFERLGGIMCTVLMVSVGYDFAPIDCIAFCRATKSPVFYVQTTGRGLRKSEGKTDLLLLDYGRVVENLGSIYDIDFFNLKKKLPTMRLCPMCESLTKKTICDCGFEFYIEKREPTVRKTNLEREAYNGTTKLYSVHASKHKSKKGNDCIKIVYMRDIFTMLATEYILPFAKEKFFRDVGAINEDDFFTNKHYRKIIAVTTFFDGKYVKIKERFYA